MIVNILINDLKVVDLEDAFSIIQKSQMSFWGFVFNIDKKEYSRHLNDEVFIKLLNYLRKENIKFNLSATANNYSRSLEVLALELDVLREKAKAYKIGKYDKIHFNTFKQFVIANIQRNLKTHQLKAAYHLYITENAANFSVPGSGKTTVILTVYEKLRLEGEVNMLFVVGPLASFAPWKNEFLETLGRNPKATIIAGGVKHQRNSKYSSFSSDRSELLLTSFQSCSSDQDEIEFFLQQPKIKAFIVIDEAHYIKQLDGNWAKAILRLSSLGKYRSVLTGTPMPKSYTDVFNLFDFLWPNSYPIDSNTKLIIRTSEQKGDRQSVKRILEERIGPLFYRVRKSDLNLLPQNFLLPSVVKMSKNERRIYDAIFTRIKHFAREEFFRNIDFITKVGKGRIMRLRQAVSYIKLLGTAIDDYSEKIFEGDKDLKYIVRNYDQLEIPSKIKVLIRKVKLIQRRGEKVVIWSNFIQTLRLIQKSLVGQGMKCKIIYGETPIETATWSSEETREKIRDEFVDPNSGLDILIANPAACSESISLHKTCSNAIYYDLSYNCAQYLQSLDRIHRVGGSENKGANYHFLLYENTIDSDILHNLEAKRTKMFDVIEHEYPIYSLNMFEDDDEIEAYKRLFKKNEIVK